MEEEKRENDVDKGVSTARLWLRDHLLLSPSQASTQHGNLKEAPKQERQPAHRACLVEQIQWIINSQGLIDPWFLREKRKDIEKPMFVVCELCGWVRNALPVLPVLPSREGLALGFPSVLTRTSPLRTLSHPPGVHHVENIVPIRPCAFRIAHAEMMACIHRMHGRMVQVAHFAC